MKPGSRLSLYRMEDNSYLGDCLCVIYKANNKEIEINGLTNSSISMYIKTKKDINDFTSISEIKNKELFDSKTSVILRIGSECHFGVFGDSHCDCESQRLACLNAIKDNGQGIYVQLPQEGQGRGLLYKAREIQIQVNGLDQSGKYIGKKDIYEAASILIGSDNLDIRKFSVLKTLFSKLNLNKYNYVLLSSNQKKVDSLAHEAGIKITGSYDIARDININNIGEYLAKLYKKSFALPDSELKYIYNVLFRAKSIPGRVYSLICHIKEDVVLGRLFTVNMDLLNKILNIANNKKIESQVKLVNNEDNIYKEYHVELEVSDEDISILFNNNLLGNLVSVYFEENYFYDLVYLKNAIMRDFKIRLTKKVSGEREIVSSSLIYKTLIGENEYNIRKIEVSDNEVVELLSTSLEGYEVHYVTVFTHLLCPLSLYPGVKTLIKRYSKNLKTISIMGEKKFVDAYIGDFSKLISIKMIPPPTNIRTANVDISLEFDYDELLKQELIFFNKYYKG